MNIQGRTSVVISLVMLCLMVGISDLPAADELTAPKLDPYLIGVEDVLSISVWGEDTLDRSVKVRPDGKISFPLVNDIEVVGKTPEQVRAVIRDSLNEFIKEPHVTVIVEEINHFRVYILGEVNQQGVMNFYRPTTLLQALATAEGITEFGGKGILLFRQFGDREARIQVDLKALLSGSGKQDNLFLRPGDTILVY